MSHRHFVVGAAVVGAVVGAGSGKTARGGLMIDEAGTYQFFCSVPGHKAMGMKGKLVVKPEG